MVFTQAGLMNAEEPIPSQEALGAASVLTLLLRAQQGEEAAFKALYEMYKARVYSACLAITQTRSSAEKLTYHVFVTLFRNIGEFQEERQFVSRMDEWTIRFSIGFLRNTRGWETASLQPGRC